MTRRVFVRRRPPSDELVLLGQRVTEDAGPIGRDNMRASKYGREVILTTNNDLVVTPQKLIKTLDRGSPMVITVSGQPVTDFVATPPQFLLKGTFGSGGATHPFEVDILPGAALTLPGSDIDADVVQELPYAATAGGTYGRDAPQAGLQYKVRATALPGYSVYDDRALRTYKFRQAGQAGGAGVGWRWPIPPFAKSFMIRGPSAATIYAATVEVRFIYAAQILPNGTSAGVIEEIEYWTGPQLQTLKLAGVTVPIPCESNAIFLQNSAASAEIFFLEFELGL